MTVGFKPMPKEKSWRPSHTVQLGSANGPINAMDTGRCFFSFCPLPLESQYVPGYDLFLRDTANFF